MGSLRGKLEGKFQRRPFPVLELYQGEQYWFRLWGNRVEWGELYISYHLRPQFICHGRSWNEDTKEVTWARGRWTPHSVRRTSCPRCLGCLTRRERATLGETIIFWPTPSLRSDSNCWIFDSINIIDIDIKRQLKQYIREIVYVYHVFAPYRLWKHWHKINNYL